MKLQKKQAILEFIEHLEMSSKREQPYLFPEVFNGGFMDTAFDRAFDLKQPRDIVMKMLNLMLNMDSDGRLYQDIIERNMQNMIKINVDFTIYLSSKMVIHEIPHSEDWEQFSKDDDDLYISVNLMSDEPADSIHKKPEIVQKALIALRNKNFIENIPAMISTIISCKTCKKGKRSKMYSQFTRKNTHTDFFYKSKCEMQYSDPSVLDKWEIEYVVVNMPMLLLKRP